MAATGKSPISVFIPTKNEERNIVECIKSVSWADQILVLDSYSSDQTVALARQMGAEVFQRQFDNYSSNKNWALRNLPFRNEFVFLLDADMRPTDELTEEICKEVGRGPAIAGYYLRIRNYFNGKWIKHGGWYPNYHLMIVKHACARVEDRLVHAHLLVEGNTKYLKNDVLHLDFKGIEHFIERHNLYSSLEAIEAYRQMTGDGRGEYLPADAVAPGPGRRRFLKALAYRYLPARAFFKFLWMYVVKLGFLDGRIGFRYCLLHAFYEYQISLKLEELKEPESPMREKYRRYLK